MAELVIGALYATGAGFQAFDTLRKSEEFYRDMANQAWLRPAEVFVERVLVPNGFTVTVLVVVFQATLGDRHLLEGRRGASRLAGRWGLLDRRCAARRPRRNRWLRRPLRHPFPARLEAGRDAANRELMERPVEPVFSSDTINVTGGVSHRQVGE